MHTLPVYIHYTQSNYTHTHVWGMCPTYRNMDQYSWRTNKTFSYMSYKFIFYPHQSICCLCLCLKATMVITMNKHSTTRTVVGARVYSRVRSVETTGKGWFMHNSHEGKRMQWIYFTDSADKRGCSVESQYYEFVGIYVFISEIIVTQLTGINQWLCMQHCESGWTFQTAETWEWALSKIISIPSPNKPSMFYHWTSVTLTQWTRVLSWLYCRCSGGTNFSWVERCWRRMTYCGWSGGAKHCIFSWVEKCWMRILSLNKPC